MKATADDFRKHFALLSDEALLDVQRGDLVDVAQTCYDEEIATRGLNEADERPAETPVPEPATGEHTDEPEQLVSIASFTSGEEAGLARGLLTSAGIPCALQNEKAALGALQLMVPESFVNDALQVLGPGALSDEELAAQAEAAGGDEVTAA